jgi:DNA-binding NtrC family response regulator
VGGVVRALAAERIAVPVVACGVGDDADAAAQAIRDGAREFLPLPPDPDLIAAILEAASGEAHAMVVRDPAMQAAVHRAEQVAASEASVLITGESGTGKEVLARHIHRRSRRAGGPFVALNCAAIPDNLLESELFGHEKGAFSGAVARRVGKFEAADGGTLLLDEISEMDIRLQAKLLRALQEKEIDRLGGGAPVRVNVRILATTNRDLMAEVQHHAFREDLYFRLNVVSLRIPALRERPGDIAALAEHFARRYAEVNGLPYRPLSHDATLRLTSHAWRGNVRELENTIHRAVLLADGPAIGIEAIELGGPAAPAAQPSVVGTIASLVGRRMEEVERDLIIETLGHTLGNRTHAATILGISIRALRNKLRDYAAQGVAVPPPAAGVAA